MKRVCITLLIAIALLNLGTRKVPSTGGGTDASDLTSGIIPVGRVGAAHIDALGEIVLCVGSGISVPEFDNSGVATCKTSVQTTLGTVIDGDLLVGQTSGGEFQNKQMSGGATMDEAGVVTITLPNVVIETGTTHTVTCAELIGTTHVSNNAAGTDYTFPEISTCGVGAWGCFYDRNGGGTVILDPATGDSFEIKGLEPASGVAIETGGAKGDYGCFRAIDANTLLGFERSGTWVQEGS